MQLQDLVQAAVQLHPSDYRVVLEKAGEAFRIHDCGAHSEGFDIASSSIHCMEVAGDQRSVRGALAVLISHSPCID